jgi:transposase
MTKDALALREHLLAEQVTCVVMEATGDYWKPFYYLLEVGPFEVMGVNARHAKNVPGRKTDVADATWLAQLAAHGLVRGSFVPPKPIRSLRDLTRARTQITRGRGRICNGWTSSCRTPGSSCRAWPATSSARPAGAMLEALIAGADDPAVLADLSQRRLRDKIPQLVDALTGRFTAHHRLLARTYLDLIDQHTRAIETTTAQIDTEMAPFGQLHDQIRTIPGIGPVSADVIIGETGADLSRFLTAGNLASWAGLTPGHNESAGKSRSARTRPGNPYLQNVLGIAAMTAARHPDTYLGARYRRIAARRGATRANHHLAHGPHRRGLPRPRRRLLHPAQPRPRRHPRHPPATSRRLPRHSNQPSPNRPVTNPWSPESSCQIDHRGLPGPHHGARASRCARRPPA